MLIDAFLGLTIFCLGFAIGLLINIKILTSSNKKEIDSYRKNERDFTKAETYELAEDDFIDELKELRKKITQNINFYS